MLHAIHILPVVVSAVVVFAIGALWYSPALFGRAWVTAHGYTDEKIQQMRAGAPRAYAVSFVCYLLMGAALSILIDRVVVTRVQGGLKLGALVGVGFAATVGLTANMFSEKPLRTWMIDAGYQIVYLMVMGAILAVWR